MSKWRNYWDTEMYFAGPIKRKALLKKLSEYYAIWLAVSVVLAIIFAFMAGFDVAAIEPGLRSLAAFAFLGGVFYVYFVLFAVLIGRKTSDKVGFGDD